jgi:hypothetical protein
VTSSYPRTREKLWGVPGCAQIERGERVPSKCEVGIRHFRDSLLTRDGEDSWCRGWESNPHRPEARGILSPREKGSEHRTWSIRCPFSCPRSPRSVVESEDCGHPDGHLLPDEVGHPLTDPWLDPLGGGWDWTAEVRLPSGTTHKKVRTLDMTPRLARRAGSNRRPPDTAPSSKIFEDRRAEAPIGTI